MWLFLGQLSAMNCLSHFLCRLCHHHWNPTRLLEFYSICKMLNSTKWLFITFIFIVEYLFLIKNRMEKFFNFNNLLLVPLFYESLFKMANKKKTIQLNTNLKQWIVKRDIRKLQCVKTLAQLSGVPACCYFCFKYPALLLLLSFMGSPVETDLPKQWCCPAAADVTQIVCVLGVEE